MPSKPYWSWTCHRCAFDDNRNTNKCCTQCGARIRCEASGGHHWKYEDVYCSNGCGTTRTGRTDLTQRRADY